MNWEAVTAVGTVFTGLVIFFTVVLGARQLRTTSLQLQQLRQATQLEGAMKIFDEMATPQFRRAYRFVVNDLRERLKDDQFRREAVMSGIDPDVHKERYVMALFERVGTYVKHGLLDEAVIYDFASPVIRNAWEATSEFAGLVRHELSDPLLWENFEYLYRGAQRWIEAHSPAEGQH